MKHPVAYEDAVNLLDADHKAVKQMFMAYGALCDDGAPAIQKLALAQRICESLTVHAQIEEEIFYPPVRTALHDNALMDEALAEHAEAKQLIARIEAMKPTSPSYDTTVKQLGKLIDAHVLKEREQIFLKASRAALDLRGMTFPLMKRQKQLTKKASDDVAKEAA
jgi:hemerythrin superfamily protein